MAVIRHQLNFAIVQDLIMYHVPRTASQSQD
jgi:hypothetical protein